jgi:hypothetical protein
MLEWGIHGEEVLELGLQPRGNSYRISEGCPGHAVDYLCPYVYNLVRGSSLV